MLNLTDVRIVACYFKATTDNLGLSLMVVALPKTRLVFKTSVITKTQYGETTNENTAHHQPNTRAYIVVLPN